MPILAALEIDIGLPPLKSASVVFFPLKSSLMTKSKSATDRGTLREGTLNFMDVFCWFK